MLRIAMRILCILLMVAVVAFIIGGMLLPDSLELDKETTIKADPALVYEKLADFRNWPQWSPWHEEDPQIIMDYNGTPSGVGAAVSWESNKFSKGRQVITAAQPPLLLRTSLQFDQRGLSSCQWTLEETAEGVRVRWTFRTEFGGNYAGRYMGLYLKRYLNNMLPRGLERLKSLCETSASATPKSP